MRLTIALLVALAFSVPTDSSAQFRALADFTTERNQIRRDKFDVVLPEVMREQGIDMWIHVMRVEVDDPFGQGEFGSNSGVFVFTDRGGDHIERAVLGRRWGAAQRERIATDYVDPIKALDAYDIVAEPIRIQEPVSGPVTEYDLRFKGLREFVDARNPKRIAVNFRHTLGQWPTYSWDLDGDGISHTDFVLLAEELGDEHAAKLESSEYLVMDYAIRKVPSEIELLREMRRLEVQHTRELFDRVKPGISRSDEIGLVTFRRMRTGQSQRGRSAGWEDSVVQGGDILSNPMAGLHAYVLRENETEPPEEVKKLWDEYRKVDAILANSIKSGLTPEQIIADYTKQYERAGIIVREDQLHMIQPKNDFASYSAGFDANKTHLTIDSHAQLMGAREVTDQTYYAPRIGSYGPSWTKQKVLQPDHHFVLEYFFYMPSPSDADEDQYLFWWAHEEALATKDGVDYLSPPQKDLYLIR